MEQGTVSFGEFPNLGGRMTFTRGINPSVCQIVMQPQPQFDRIVDTLEFNYGGVVLQFRDACTPGPFFHHRRDREGYRWVLPVFDRRWKWQYPRIDGIYNRRGPDSRVSADSRTSIRDLMGKCLDALEETNYDVSRVPSNVYPQVAWNRAKAALELEWLCDLVGMTVVLKLDNTVAVLPINDTSGAELPDDLPVVSEFNHSWKSSMIPQAISLEASPTLIQDLLPLEAVGLDVDGAVVPLEELSYKPTSGFGWPEFFAEVSQDHRHLAFQTVYRWYRPKLDEIDGDGITIAYRDQLHLLDRLADVGTDDEGEPLPLPSVVRGNFWAGNDHPTNTEDACYAGEFRVDTEKGLVIFKKPVFSWAGGEPAPAVISLLTAYRVSDWETGDLARYKRERNVDPAPYFTPSWVVRRPEMFKVKRNVVAYPEHAAADDNKEYLNVEADAYLDALAAMFSYSQATESIYEGLLNLNLDGAISQLEYRCGDGFATTTRVGRYTEFDYKTVQHRQRRASNRLAQMAERLNV